MSDMTAEKLGQRITDAGLLDSRQLESIWGELGTREVTLDQFTSLLMRRELLTNFQLDRLIKGERSGYFYGNYRVLYLTGTGTFARVYRAVEKETARVVAVKVLRKRFRDDGVMTEQFLREGQIGAGVRHPNIVPIYEVSSNPNAPYLVMEFVEGRNLREMVKVRKKLTPAESMRITVDVLTGLAYAAEKGMSHRDLKLSNVLITSKGRAKLVDFGLAAIRSTETVKDDDSPNARTIDYAGLERASGCRANDPRSDLYFVGCMLYHMVTGVPPMYETRDRIQRLSISRYQNIKPILQVDSSVPKAIAAFVTRSIELSTEKRFSKPTEMLEEAKKVQARVEAGEVADAEAAATASASGEVAPTAAAKPVEMEGADRTIMIVESRIEMQDVFREKLKKYGYRVLVFSDPARAITRIEDAATKLVDCVLFSTLALADESLDAFNKFGANEATKKIPAILFVDPKQSDLIKGAKLSDKRVVVSMPLKVRELRETLTKLLG
jgi:tRNA A-37 threonylcarbamoyl transferase component Bud32/CheY-like chemotaxis protein